MGSEPLPQYHIDPRIGLMIWTPVKSFSLSVTTMQSFAPAMAAMIISSPLRPAGGFPFCHQPCPDEARLLVEWQDAAREQNLRPSRPENQASRPARPLPFGISRIPRRISASVSEAMNKCSSRRAAIQARSDSNGYGLTTLMMTLVSRR